MTMVIGQDINITEQTSRPFRATASRPHKPTPSGSDSTSWHQHP